jgi:hypothetical protein
MKFLVTGACFNVSIMIIEKIPLHNIFKGPSGVREEEEKEEEKENKNND